MLDDEEPKDWEKHEEENPPENLRRKWIEREYFGKDKTVRCGTCKKFVPAENLECLFCGATMNHDTGLLGKILRWIKGIF